MFGNEDLTDLKNVIKMSGKENSTMTLNKLYDLATDHGMHSGPANTIKPFLKEYGNRKLVDIMKL